VTGVAKRQIRRDVQGVTHETTDLRNKECFVEMHRDVFRHVGKWGKDLTWGGPRWVLDDTGGGLRLAAETARIRVAQSLDDLHVAQKAYAEAEEAGDERCANSAKRRIAAANRLFQWAVKSQNASRLNAMLALARTDATIAIRHEDLDANPMLLNVANGTIDLVSGELRPHDPADRITKLADVVFDKDAKCPTWDAFLHHSMGGNAEMVDFLWRAVGYCLTGSIVEHILVFLYGPTGTGKSTFFGLLHDVLGDYASRAPRGLLFQSRGDRHETELTTLFGARVATCNEIDEGATFDEALVKDLTGGERMTARRMREDHWTWAPTHKILIGGNHKPNVRNFDDAIRRRLRLVPWAFPPKTVDKALPEKLRAERPGILAWAVRGCLEWQKRGLGEPVAVREATDAYQEESDVLGEFMRLYVSFADPDAATARKALRTAYEEYARENGLSPVGAKRFAKRLRDKGVTETTVRTGGKSSDGWRGVRLLTDLERVAAGRWERRDIGTCRDQVTDESPRENITLSINRDLPPTSPLLTTGAEPFADDDGEPFYEPDDADERMAIVEEGAGGSNAAQ